MYNRIISNWKTTLIGIAIGSATILLPIIQTGGVEAVTTSRIIVAVLSTFLGMFAGDTPTK